MWESITTAPYDGDLELAVIDDEGEHCLVFPSRRILGGWVNADTGLRIDVRPTHWRAWNRQTAERASAPAWLHPPRAGEEHPSPGFVDFLGRSRRSPGGFAGRLQQ